MPAKSPYAGCADLVALGTAVRVLRERLEVPQLAVGYDARLSRNYLSMLELGQLNPSFMTLLWIARTLGYSMADAIAVYEKKVERIDPQAGSEVPACPTPEALAFAQRISDEVVARKQAQRSRRARSRIRRWT
jgi:transcriptional regulator with XRE-family HTH domain